MDAGIMYIQLSAFGDKIDATIAETIKALHNFKEHNFTIEEFEEVKTPLLAKIKSSLFVNDFWLNLITNLQSNIYLPEHKHKTIDSISDVVEYYDHITPDDIKDAINRYLILEPFAITVGMSDLNVH